MSSEFPYSQYFGTESIETGIFRNKISETMKK